ncbi:protein kinase domain-containing protein [Kurthia zopfii]|uniref:protein kinase domain-containing protein n=1 Tax=Kurthia zopfii TaxID=1650 RepID=UPI000F705131|nr:serine/threonine-protein kinase [Kurthia zopfii]VEI07690.1 Serine/threonine-protein kinase PrkC [Kurthia zopfii]
MESTQYKRIKTIATHADWNFHIVFCNKRKKKLFMKELINSDINPLKKMYYEKSITTNNDSNWIIQPIAIEEFKTSHCMLYEHTNTIPLTDLSQDKLTLSQFKKISLAIVNSFIGFEQQQQLFQSLDARYILVNQKNFNISYINYDSFISFYSENLNSQNELVHNSTAINYFSPEQTGQTNQQLDYRSDLYSVGILFYNLLTNSFPFENENSENLIYDILTKPAPLLKKLRPDLPIMLSEIINKLLQKDKTSRYQSAQGLKNDLDIVFKNISFNASV